MLRLTPTVTSLTMAEVTEVGHRRRFRRFLEADEPAGVSWVSTMNHTESGSTFNITQFNQTSQPHSSKRDMSPPINRSRPLVVDPPVMLLHEQRVEEHLSPMPEPSGSLERGVKAGEEQRQGPGGTVQLCIRLRRSSLPAATEDDVMLDPGCATSQHVSPERDTHMSEKKSITEQTAGGILGTSARISLPESGSQVPSRSTSAQRAEVLVDGADTTLETETGPSTPRRSSSLESFAATTPPVLSGRLSPVPSEGSDFHASQGSPTAAFQTQGRFRIYDDSLPASSQPQTPRNLPEARHQSRLLGSFTAPARRTSSHLSWTPTRSRSRRGFGRRRETSPLGSRTPGLMGLYGGRENIHDAAVIEEMVEGTRERGRRVSPTSRLRGSA